MACDCKLKKMTTEEVESKVKELLSATDGKIIEIANLLDNGEYCKDIFPTIFINMVGALAWRAVKLLDAAIPENGDLNKMAVIKIVSSYCDVPVHIDFGEIESKSGAVH